jgi:hypothetical protein
MGDTESKCGAGRVSKISRIGCFLRSEYDNLSINGQLGAGGVDNRCSFIGGSERESPDAWIDRRQKQAIRP